MKKTIASVVLAATAATGAQAVLEDLSLSGTFAYESLYVFRGIRLAEDSFQPSVELAYPIGRGELYAGAWANLPVTSLDSAAGPDIANEVDWYLGYDYPITDIFSIGAGYTLFSYPDSDTPWTNEVGVGVSADVLLSPALYFYYDFNLEQIVVEGSIGYSFDLEEYTGVPAAIDLGAYLAYLYTDGTDIIGRTEYTYGGITGDLTYSISENVSASLGLRFSANDENDNQNPNGDSTNFWWGGSIGFSY